MQVELSSPIPHSIRACGLAQRIREAAGDLGCTIAWTRSIGPHVLLGLGESEAFARVTALGGNAFGLAFRNLEHVGHDATSENEFIKETIWEPMLLVDDLSNVVEHALVAEGALALEAAGM